MLSVRDRLHLAEVMRMLKRSPAVLRVARIKFPERRRGPAGVR